MTLTETQKEILENIRGKLKYGDMKSIAEKTGKSENYVSMVLSPSSEHFNMKIVESAAAIIAKREQNTKKLLEQITSAA